MLIAEEKVKLNACLTKIKDEHLTEDPNAYGNLKLINKKTGKVVDERTKDCCQFIWQHFERGIRKVIDDKEKHVTGLAVYYQNGVSYDYKDFCLEMIIDLDKFVNPLSDKWSATEYIDAYLTLLQKMGSPWTYKSIDKKSVVLTMDYNDIDWNEKPWLVFHWQAIRNLILPYTLHVPARFIELADLYKDDFSLIFLYQAAKRMVPWTCYINQRGMYQISNYSAFVTITADPIGIKNIKMSKLNRLLNDKNLRKRLQTVTNCKELFDNTILYNNSMYEKLYKTLTKPQSKEDLYLKLRLLKANKL